MKTRMMDVRFTWAFALLDLPLAVVEHLVQTILTKGAGADARMVSAGAMDPQATVHTLGEWMRAHHASLGVAGAGAVCGLIAWVDIAGTRDPVVPDLLALVAALLMLCRGDWNRKAELLFALFGFNGGGPRPPTRAELDEPLPVHMLPVPLYGAPPSAPTAPLVHPANEPIMTPDELALLVRSVCAGLSLVGLGSSFAPPSAAELARLAEGAQRLSRGADAKPSGGGGGGGDDDDGDDDDGDDGDDDDDRRPPARWWGLHGRPPAR